MKSPIAYIKEQQEYLNDNPNKLWFKRKLYGWGWTPATWQGWTVIGVYLLIVLGFVTIMGAQDLQSQTDAITFAIIMIVSTAILITICYKKGESPKWQWGREQGENRE